MQLVYNEGIAVMQRVKVDDVQHLVVTLRSPRALFPIIPPRQSKNLANPRYQRRSSVLMHAFWAKCKDSMP